MMMDRVGGEQELGPEAGVGVYLPFIKIKTLTSIPTFNNIEYIRIFYQKLTKCDLCPPAHPVGQPIPCCCISTCTYTLLPS